MCPCERQSLSPAIHLQAGNTATALATLKQYIYTGRQHFYSTGNTQTVHLHRQHNTLNILTTHNTATITLATLYCNQISAILCSLVHSQNIIQSPPKEKKSSPHTSTSYWSISMIPIAAKICNRILLKREPILTWNQNGFRNSCSTTDHHIFRIKLLSALLLHTKQYHSGRTR